MHATLRVSGISFCVTFKIYSHLGRRWCGAGLAAEQTEQKLPFENATLT
jgi:hypothetical protein